MILSNSCLIISLSESFILIICSKDHNTLMNECIFFFFFCRFFDWHDREFHVATLPYKPDFKVMPEGWDGSIKDPDEVLYEISMKEDEILYQEFLEKFNFNKMKVSNFFYFIIVIRTIILWYFFFYYYYDMTD